MIFKETNLKGAFIIEMEPIRDNRGFFARAWCQKEFEAHGLITSFVQANITFSPKKGTLRGLHYQIAPHEEIKLVRCTRGAIYDVIIDLRPESPTYRQWLGTELTADNRKMIYIPGGFAHGYQILIDDTEVFYQVGQFYAPEHERGIRWDDPAFEIDWPIASPLILSEKDKRWPDYSLQNPSEK
ncbi:MAG TPA: dTDP-4-dehydrorhamnose 3,5-epimerase [Anaerolineae bacterium]|nr:dTDP-4-dehydrorhamnose 3,5-epimerase [Anaerolineae bacterium]